MSEFRDVYNKITNKIIADLEQGPAGGYGCDGSPPDHDGVSRRLGRRRSGQPEPPGARRSAETTRLSGHRDLQRRRVYAWEERVVAPCDPTSLPFPAAQAMVDAIWSDMGLRYPPVVAPLPRQATATVARANRLSILLADRTPSWCLLHELAHAMTSHADGSRVRRRTAAARLRRRPSMPLGRGCDRS
jgi:hypothetical protein